MKKSTWIAFSFFCLMELAAFPYSVLAFDTGAVIFDRIPPDPIVSSIQIQATVYDPSFLFWGDTGYISFCMNVTCSNYEPYTKDIQVTFPTTDFASFVPGDYSWWTIFHSTDGVNWDSSLPTGMDSFTLTNPPEPQQPENTSTLVIASFGTILWEEVASNIFTILSICFVLAFIFWIFNKINVWKK